MTFRDFHVVPLALNHRQLFFWQHLPSQAMNLKNDKSKEILSEVKCWRCEASSQTPGQATLTDLKKEKIFFL